MISAWTWVILAGAVSKTSAFDPAGYIMTLPADAGDDSPDDDNEPPEALPKSATANTVVLRADVTVDSKPLVALRSAFGTIYLTKGEPLTSKTLAAAACANTKAAPDIVGPYLPLADQDAVKEAEVLQAISSHCQAAKPRSKQP